jgi:hypothetical protein
MAGLSPEAEQLARLLVDAETDDDVDIITLIDEASPAVRAEVAAVQRRRLESEEV